MTIRQAVNAGIARLKKSKSSSPALDAQVLLCFAIGRPKEFLFINPDAKLSVRQIEKYQGLVSKRVLNRPIAYLTNAKEFYKLPFYVNENVLIPRPLTEELVMLVEKLLSGTKGMTVLDVGTGSGAIIIALAKNLPGQHQYFASDISGKALSVARRNAKTHKVKVNFQKSDLMSGIKKDFDVVVANLPYLKSVKDPSAKFEPKKALLSSAEGTGHYRELLKQLGSRKVHPKHLFLEMHRRQKGQMMPLIKQRLPKTKVSVVWDNGQM